VLKKTKAKKRKEKAEETMRMIKVYNRSERKLIIIFFTSNVYVVFWE
jgi:hypothetical protein